MKFFLDTADVNELREGAALGVVDGVTTNPSLIAKTKRPLGEVVKEIVEIVNGPISVETVGQTAQEMITEGRAFAKVHPNIVVKAPLTQEGIKATKILSSEGIRVNVTLIFSPVQALLAAKAGATYVSPFIGRLDDVGFDGMELIRSIATIFRNYEFSTNILAASIRHPVHVLRCAEAGAHVGTMPLKTLQTLFNHPLTDIGLEKFMADWNNYQKK
jgi:transaldolase